MHLLIYHIYTVFLISALTTQEIIIMCACACWITIMCVCGLNYYYVCVWVCVLHYYYVCVWVEFLLCVCVGVRVELLLCVCVDWIIIMCVCVLFLFRFFVLYLLLLTDFLSLSAGFCVYYICILSDLALLYIYNTSDWIHQMYGNTDFPKDLVTIVNEYVHELVRENFVQKLILLLKVSHTSHITHTHTQTWYILCDLFLLYIFIYVRLFVIFFAASLITHHTSHITHRTSHIIHHTSHITHHTSHITHHNNSIHTHT